MGVVAKVVMNLKNIKAIQAEAQEAMIQALTATTTDLKQAQTVPFDVGILQNTTTVDDSEKYKNRAKIISHALYAGKLYFHPEYNYRKTNNANAGAGWFDPYITGGKKDFIRNAYGKLLRRRLARLSKGGK